MSYSLLNLSKTAIDNLEFIVQAIADLIVAAPKLAIVFLVLRFVLHIFYGILVGNLASKKGHSFFGVFILCFFVPILGILYTIGLPDLTVQEKLDDIIYELDGKVVS